MIVEAAGGVVLRDTDDGPQVLLVHRPRYDDWTLPKGKLDPGESFEDAARREVEEETGLRCELAGELPSAEYRDNKDRPKLVRYWLMELEDDPGEFEPNDEVDQIRWVPLNEAAEALTYPCDWEVLAGLGRPPAG